MGRITWVCATCSEHFTRQYGATRHNNKLHDGKGVVVRLLDYIVGVANGRFLPSESNVQRRKKRMQSSFFSFNSKRFQENYERYAHGSVVHEDVSFSESNTQTNSGSNASTVSSSARHFNHDWPFMARQGNYRKCNNFVPDSRSNVNVETKSEVQEIHVLLNKHFPPEQARQYFELVDNMAVLGNYDKVHKILLFLRASDMQAVNYRNIFDKLSNSTGDKMSNATDVLDPSLPQQAWHTDILHNMPAERYLQGTAKLAEIEQLLLSSKQLPREFIRKVIKDLTIVFNATGDLSALHKAYQNHLKNVQPYAR
jgi:hypothetical protein